MSDGCGSPESGVHLAHGKQGKECFNFICLTIPLERIDLLIISCYKS